jgi:hypothetical protein
MSVYSIKANIVKEGSDVEKESLFFCNSSFYGPFQKCETESIFVKCLDIPLLEESRRCPTILEGDREKHGFGQWLL